MYDRGLSIQNCADYFQITRQAMWKILRRRTTLRPREKFGKANHFYRGGAAVNDRAHNMVEIAVANGALIRKACCEQCGSSGTFKDGRSKIHAHHDDYNKPLCVRWLCQKCHHEWHKTNRAIPLVS